LAMSSYCTSTSASSLSGAVFLAGMALALAALSVSSYADADEHLAAEASHGIELIG